jgi:hypothetical protein
MKTNRQSTIKETLLIVTGVLTAFYTLQSSFDDEIGRQNDLQSASYEEDYNINN